MTLVHLYTFNLCAGENERKTCLNVVIDARLMRRVLFCLGFTPSFFDFHFS